jgi:SRSO17 transposase
MSLLEHPCAQALLEDAEVTAEDVRGCRARLSRFLQRYLPLFYREEQRDLAEVVIRGKLSNLQRKTAEPIAYAANRERKPVQHFVGAGRWDDEAVMSELRRHVSEGLGDDDGVLIVDPSAFAKKGTESCGVARQWCGRLGKIDNCQVGVFVSYASRKGHALLDRRLYLSKEWALDRERREKCHVPADVVFQEKWRIAQDLLERCLNVPHAWVCGDDELGRVTAFRGWLRLRQQTYVLDVPANTLVREISRDADGHKAAFVRAEVWAARQPASRWQTITIRQGAKGPIKVRALKARVQTKDEDGRVGRTETLVVTRTLDQDKRTTYRFSNAPSTVKLWKLVYVGSERHRIEESLQEAKGEVGLAHYEVRSWVGWHHHMTLSMLALWFLTLEKRRLGEKSAGHNGAANPRNLDTAAGPEASEQRPDCPRDQSRAAPQRGGPHLPPLHRHRPVPTAPRGAGGGFMVEGLQ